MNTTLTRWGNSLAIRLPKAFTEQIGVSDGDSVSLDLQDNKIIIGSSDISLNDLMLQVNLDNIHCEASIDNPVGNEIW